jgi:hypothetical protein
MEIAIKNLLNLGHSAIHDKVRSINEAALIASKEYDGPRLLNSLPKSSSGEMNLSAVTLYTIITQPVLEKRRTYYCATVSGRKGYLQMSTYFKGAGQRELKRNPEIIMS